MALHETLPVTLGVEQWSLWSTTARIVTADPSAPAAARRLAEPVLAAVEHAASRFRDDSEVCRPALLAGRLTEISPTLQALVRVALDAAARTDGAVDPTVGHHLVRLGYDEQVAGLPPRRAVALRRPVTWRDVELDGPTIRVPAGVVLDLGATAKAWAADRCAEVIGAELGTGVLVALGGDVRVVGDRGAGPWTVLVQDGPDQPPSLVDLLGARAVATSSTRSRSWERDGRRMHHVVDPLTGLPAVPRWRTVSVAAATCVEANTWSTACLVRPDDAPDLLRRRGSAARLVAADGAVERVGGWPS